VLYTLHRYIYGLQQRQLADMETATELTPPPVPTSYMRFKNFFLAAPEKGLGLWLGTMLMYFLYLLSATANHYRSVHHEHINNEYTGGVAGFHTVSPLDLGAQSFVYHDRVLYYVVCALYATCVVAWVRMVWFCTDPGIIDTRDANFEEVSVVLLRYCVYASLLLGPCVARAICSSQASPTYFPLAFGACEDCV
jgi:hypothetical protein